MEFISMHGAINLASNPACVEMDTRMHGDFRWLTLLGCFWLQDFVHKKLLHRSL